MCTGAGLACGDELAPPVIEAPGLSFSISISSREGTLAKGERRSTCRCCCLTLAEVGCAAVAALPVVDEGSCACISF